MAKNTELINAKKQKKDEFYTQLSDVEKELKYYKKHFNGKTIYMNCDDTSSAFWEYFHLNFNQLKLKKLIATHYDAEKKTYKIEYTGGNDLDLTSYVKTDLLQNGDFRSDECIELLKESDIVVTNPPFSLFREYLAQLMEYEKKFIILGNMNAVTYKEVFPYFKDNKVWYGASVHSGDRKFYVPDDYPLNASTCGIDEEGKRFIRVKGVRWFTNLSYTVAQEGIVLYQRYYDDNGNPLPDIDKKYPKYDNYNAINVDKVTNIPCDYFGIMGVPITFLDKYNPSDTGESPCSTSSGFSGCFKIVGVINHGTDGDWDLCKCVINGKEKFKRLAIKRKSG